MKRTPIQLRMPIISDKQYCCPYEEPFGYIYLVTNKVNGHVYVGKHEWHKPWIDESYKGSGESLSRAYNKYGTNNFEVTILEWTDKDNDELNRLEKYWIDMFGAFKFLFHYNLTKGGDGASLPGEKNPMYGDHRFAGKNNPNYGKPCTQYCKEQTKKANTGKRDTLETTEKRRNSHLGAKNGMYGAHFTTSVTTINKLSDSCKRVWTKELRRQKSKQVRGKLNGKYGKHYNHRPVVQLTLEGDFISYHETMVLAKLNSGISCGESGIYACCSGKQHTCGGFRWMYKDDYETLNRK